MARSIETVKPDQSGRYVDGTDRDEYIGRAAKLLDARKEPAARYGPRWVITLAMLDSGEKIAIGLAANGTRDTMFEAVRADLDADGADAFEPMCLYRQEREGGNPFWSLRSATADEIAEAESDAAAGAGEDAPEGADDPLPGETIAPKKRGR